MTDSSLSGLHFKLKELAHNTPADKSLVRSRLQDAFYDYQLGHCYNPQTIYVQDSFSGYLVKREVPCGSCYYCRNNHINEWVTRHYAHLADYKNAYFITLTYAPYYTRSDAVDLYMLRYLEDALFLFDNENEKHRYGWNPCVLCKKHYQDFFKRLRRYTGLDDITYSIAGEYGSEFGRPHFHAIIFTNGKLTAKDVKRAWSVALVHHPDGTVCAKTSNKCDYFWSCDDRKHKDYYWYQSIGRVDFNDLVDNGTITNQSLLVDGRPMSGHDCFAYVCKYCNKQQGNEKRLSKAFDALRKIYKPYETLKYQLLTDLPLVSRDESNRIHSEACCNEEAAKVRLYVSSPDALFTKVHQEVGLVSVDSAEPTGPMEIKVTDPLFTYEERYPDSYREFLSAFGCFLSVSRGTPIGSLYVKSHLEEMANGNFPQPRLQTKCFVVPKYFLAKVDEYIYGLRKYNSKGNATKGNLPIVRGLFDFETDDNTIINWSISHSVSTPLADLLHSPFAFTDRYTKERMLIWRRIYNSSEYFYVNSYTYDRKLKRYQFVRSRSLGDFCNYYKDKLLDAIARHKETEANTTANNMKRVQCSALLSKILGSDYIKKLGYRKIKLTNFDEYCIDAIARLEDNVKHHKEEIKLHKKTDLQ